jgi:hypothetical protein
VLGKKSAVLTQRRRAAVPVTKGLAVTRLPWRLIQIVGLQRPRIFRPLMRCTTRKLSAPLPLKKPIKTHTQMSLLHQGTDHLRKLLKTKRNKMRSPVFQ